jgi:hypothetical protein
MDDLTLEIGYRYVPHQVNSLNGHFYNDPRVQPARPGDRAPHLILEQGGAIISLLDLFGQKFVLLAGSKGEPWLKVGTAAAASRQLPLGAYRIGPDSDLIDVDGSFQERYGLDAAGAVLVRPDGYIAWRSQPGDTPSHDSMSEVFGRLAGHHETKVDAGSLFCS